MAGKELLEDNDFRQLAAGLKVFAEKNDIDFLIGFVLDNNDIVRVDNIDEDSRHEMLFTKRFLQSSTNPDTIEDTGKVFDIMSLIAINGNKEELAQRIEKTKVNPPIDDLLNRIEKNPKKEIIVIANELFKVMLNNDVPFIAGFDFDQEVFAFMNDVTTEHSYELFFAPFIMTGDLITPTENVNE